MLFLLDMDLANFDEYMAVLERNYQKERNILRSYSSTLS